MKSPVDTFMEELDHPRKADIEIVRGWILKAAPGMIEGIKWKAPSFRRANDLDDFATFRLQPPPTLQLILHRGAKARHDLPDGMKIEDPEKLLKWAAPDRAILSFGDSHVKTHEKATFSILRQWMKQL
jgi:hypothetical protein